jgi:molybdopterin molybdotransferase
MISLEEALKKIDQAVEPLPPRSVPLLEAVGCTTTEDIRAPFNVPDFASSAMDGIALAYQDLSKYQLPISLTVQGTIPAGEPAAEPLRPGHAFRIMTGAPLPEKADTIIKVEELEFEDDLVKISRMPEPGEHVRPVANDIREGEVVLHNGHPLRPADVGICASLGLTEVLVHPNPRVAVLATGSEIQPPGNTLKPGQIYNSNDTTLNALLRAIGIATITQSPPLPDDQDKLASVLKQLSETHDVLITSGAVSAGSFDYIPEIAEELGGDVLFHKVFVKPGKPTLMAKLGNCWLLGLPGNPVSVVVTFHLYGKRLLNRLRGQNYESVREKARLTAYFPVKGDRFQVVGASLNRKDGDLTAEPVQKYTSGRLSSLRGINGFVLVPGGTREVAVGSIVDVEWL